MKPLTAAIKQVNTEMAVMGKTAQTTAPLLTRMQTAAVAFGARMRAAASGMTAARAATLALTGAIDRKSTRLNSSHVAISYAVFCLKKKNETATHAASGD